MKKLIVTILLPISLVGCINNSDDIFLTCNGYSAIFNVYGKNVEEKKEPSIYSVQIKRNNTGVFNLFKEPTYDVTVGDTYFNTETIFSDKDVIVGQIEKDRKEIVMFEKRFHLNRNTNHLIFKDSFFKKQTKDNLNQQNSVTFEGKCERVKEKI